MAIGKISSSGVIIGGMIGQKGAMGKTGPIGKTPHLTIGKVETVEEIEQANVTITGTDENPVFNILLPRGEKGETGKTGLTPKIEIGTVSTLNSDENAIVNISGTKEELVLDIGIPRGKKGDNYVLQESDKQEIINDITFNANSEFNLTVNTKTEEFNVNASTKTKEFNDNATTKNNTFNTNAQSKQEEYDSNAQSKQESYDTNASRMLEEYNENAKKSKESFDTNVITKTTEFNDNVTQKTSDFNQNVTSKTDEFNSNAYAKTQEFNSNAEQKTNEFNENASSLQEQFSKVVEENEQLNKTISNLPKIKEQTGTDLTLENTSVGYFYHENKKGMRLAGNIEQETTKGEQLYNYKDTNNVTNGITVDDEGWITISYDNTEGTNAKYFNYYTHNLDLELSTDYNIIAEIKDVKGNGKIVFASSHYTTNNGQFVNDFYRLFASLSANSIIKFINTTKSEWSGDIGIRTFIEFQPGQSGSITFRLSVLKDTTITPETFVYEKFTGGQPSPNLDYPSDARVVRGKNQFDKENVNVINCYFSNSTAGILTKDLKHRTLYKPIKGSRIYTIQKNNLGQTEVRFAVGTTTELPAEGVHVNQIFSNMYATNITITTDKNAKYLVVWYYCTENTEITEEEVLDSIQIEEGSIATKYMPFNTIGIKVMNENFLPFNNQDFIIPNKGIHFYCKDGNLYVDGASIGETSSTTIEFKTYFSFYLYPGIYYLSRGTYKEPIYLRKYDDNSELIANEGQITIYKKTLVYLGLYIYQQTFSNTMLPIRLEKLPVATTYIPHQEQNYPLSLGDLWLGKIGKYEDYFYKENNEWYLYKIIAKVVLNGSEDWFTLVNLNFSNTSWLQNRDILSDSLSILAISNDYLYCNSFTISNIYNPSTQQGLCYHTDRRVQIRINNDLLDTTSPETIVSSFKTYLSNHRVELYYVLATPKAEKITDTTLIKQLDDLENALSYQGQTNISQDADVPFRISASALYDLNNLIDRVAVLETV